MLVKEFEEERRVLQDSHAQQLVESSGELTSLRKRYALQQREMAHVKKLARRILDQRSEVEIFFLEALGHVRNEITANR